MRKALVLISAVCVTALVGCGSGSSSGAAAPATSLTFVVHDAAGSTARTVRLECPGSSAARRKACAALKAVGASLFQPVPKGQMCSMLYAGPQTATVTGRFEGTTVSSSYRRSNGCETARWGRLQTVLTPLGVPAP